MKRLSLLAQITLALFNGCLPVAGALWLRSHRVSQRYDFSLSPAHAVAPQAALVPALPITLDVDATRSAPGNMLAKQAVIDAMNAWQALPNPDPTLAEPPDWRLWGRIDFAVCPARLGLPAGLPATTISTYATSGPGSCVICVINHAAQPITARIAARLPGGVYMAERLTFAPNSPGIRSAEGGAAATATPAAQLERLEGQDQTATATVIKEGRIEPGQVVFYRYTDQDRAVRGSYWEARGLLRQIAIHSPGPAHKLLQMLREGDSSLNALNVGTSDGARKLTRRLQGVHGLLMVTAQAQSLHHDYQIHGTVGGKDAVDLMLALENLLDHLAEYSAVLLRLVPQVTVEPDVALANGPIAQPVSQQPTPRFQRVELTLANTGERDIGSVKLGIPSTGLPSGASCEPSDSAVFGTLRAGQTARAAFRIHRLAGDVVPGSRCVADVCFQAGGGPVHMRPRPW